MEQRLKAPFRGDANDHIYQWEASRDYDPEPGLERITAGVLAINSADDERNPPELGVLDKAIARIPHAQAYVIPASADTLGHSTVGLARFYQDRLAQVLTNHGNTDIWTVKLSRDTITGIPSLSTDIISLFPNPVQNQLNISLSTQAEEYIVYVYNLQGKIILLPITFTNFQVQLNTTSLAEGFYTIRIINNETGRSEVGKFVKVQ